MHRAVVCIAIASASCSSPSDTELKKAKAEIRALEAELAAVRAELAKVRASEKRPFHEPKRPESLPRFDPKDMVSPVSHLREYPIEDYRKLPNCLSVFKGCIAIPYEGKTTAQYKSEVSRVAQQPCRVVLKVVDISAEYDFAQFEILTDDSKSALHLLRQGVNGDQEVDQNGGEEVARVWVTDG